MEETQVIENKPKRKELMAQNEKLKSELSSAKWNREYAERKQKEAETKVKELQAYIKGLKGEDLKDEEDK